MIHIDTDDLLTFAKGLRETHLYTLYEGAAFAVRFDHDKIIFVPSTGLERPHERKYLEQDCEAFNRINSLAPATYQDGTFNASYVLAIIAKYLGSLADGTFVPRGRRTDDS